MDRTLKAWTGAAVGAIPGVILLLGTLVVPAEAQRLNVHQYANEEGLPQSQVLAFHQTSEGYLWFGTYGGLARFNGAEFRTLTTIDGLSANVVQALAQGPDGTLHLGTLGGGVCRLPDPGTPFPPAGSPEIVCDPVPPGLPGDIADLAVDAQGRVWVAGLGGLAVVDEDGLRAVVLSQDATVGGVRRLAIDEHGTLWIATGDGLRAAVSGDLDAVVEGGPETLLPLHTLEVPGIEGRPVDLVRSLATGLVVATDSGVFLLQGDGAGGIETVPNVLLELPSPLLPEEIRFRDAVRTPGGVTWVATTHGLVRWSGATDVERITTANGLPWDDLTRVGVDHEGTVWVGSDQGAAAFVPGPFRAYGEAEGLPHPFARALAVGEEGALWVGTRAGVAIRDPGASRFRTVVSADALPDGRIYSLATIPGGVLVGEATGLLAVVDEVPGPILGVEEGLPASTPYALEPDPLEPGAVWVGTDGGIVRWRSDGLEVPDADHPLRAVAAASLRAEGDGRLWIGLVEGGIRLWDGDSLHTFGPAEGLTEQVIWDLDLAPDGSLWAGSNGDGVYRIVEGAEGEWIVERFGIAEGLRDPFVWQVLVDDSGALWVYTNQGLFRREGEDPFQRFGRADGLADLEGAATAVAQTPDRQIWFGSGLGITVWNPAAVPVDPVPPRVRIEEAWLGSDPVPPGARFRMRSDFLQFRFSALSFRDPAGIRYRYRLVRGESIDPDADGWSEPEMQRAVSLAGLRPGRYTFEVQAIGSDGLVSEEPDRFSFEVTPAFWQTWWFMLLVTLLVVGLAWLLPWARSRRIAAERERVIQELRATEARLQEIVEHTSNVFYAHTPEHEITYVSPTAEDVLGIPASEVPERWTQLVTDHPVNEVGMRHTERALETGEQQPPYELHLRHGAGHPVWVRVFESPVVRNGQVTGIVGSLTDITETKRAEEEQERLEAQLEQARRMEAVGRLAGGIAHDFNNLLTAIMGHVNLMALDLEEDDPHRNDLDEIGEACDRAASLVAQLLAIGRRQVSRPSALDVNRVIDDRVRMFRRVVGDAIEIETELEPGEVLAVLDESQLDQILLNLVVNARDAMPEGGRLVIGTGVQELDEPPAGWNLEDEAFRPGPYLHLDLTDSGVGMTPEVEARIFEPFFTTKELGEGSGLGLSTVYGIVRQNHGHVEVRTTPGVGTRFRIWLPVELPVPESVDEEAP